MSRYWKVTKYIVLLAITGTMITISVMMASSRSLKSEYHWSKHGSTQAIVTSDKVRSLLSGVKDTELDANINELGLVYDVVVPHAGAVNITMTLTTPVCPYGPEIIARVKEALLSDPAIDDVRLRLVFDPPWSWNSVSTDVRNRILLRFAKVEELSKEGKK